MAKRDEASSEKLQNLVTSLEGVVEKNRQLEKEMLRCQEDMVDLKRSNYDIRIQLDESKREVTNWQRNAKRMMGIFVMALYRYNNNKFQNLSQEVASLSKRMASLAIVFNKGMTRLSTNEEKVEKNFKLFNRILVSGQNKWDLKEEVDVIWEELHQINAVLDDYEEEKLLQQAPDTGRKQQKKTKQWKQQPQHQQQATKQQQSSKQRQQQRQTQKQPQQQQPQKQQQQQQKQKQQQQKQQPQPQQKQQQTQKQPQQQQTQKQQQQQQQKQQPQPQKQQQQQKQQPQPQQQQKQQQRQKQQQQQQQTQKPPQTQPPAPPPQQPQPPPPPPKEPQPPPPQQPQPPPPQQPQRQQSHQTQPNPKANKAQCSPPQQHLTLSALREKFNFSVQSRQAVQLVTDLLVPVTSWSLENRGRYVDYKDMQLEQYVYSYNFNLKLGLYTVGVSGCYKLVTVTASHGTGKVEWYLTASDGRKKHLHSTEGSLAGGGISYKNSEVVWLCEKGVEIRLKACRVSGDAVFWDSKFRGELLSCMKS